MKRRPFLFLGSALAPLILCALDVNNDQMSDVYVAHYGLAAGSGDEDPDGDEQNNYIESVWGTDPFDRTSVFSPSSIQVTSSLFDFSIPTVAGKRYQFRGSPSLAAGSWIDVDLPFTGTGVVEHMLTMLPISGTDKFFWRVRAVSPLDGDADGLDSFEELLLGTSDSATDSDGDKVSDLNEFVRGLNPSTNLDADSDGLPDDWELFHSAYSPDADNDGDGWTNLEEFATSEDPNSLNSKIAEPTLEIKGDYTLSGGVYTINDGGNLVVTLRSTARAAKTHYYVQAPHLEPYLRFDGSSSSLQGLSYFSEPEEYDPEAKQAAMLKINNGIYTITAQSYLDSEASMIKSDKAEWTIKVRPYPSSGIGLPSGMKYVSMAYYDPDTGLYHDFAFDVPQNRRRILSGGWLTDATSSFNPDWEGFIPDLTTSASAVYTAFRKDTGYSSNSLSSYWYPTDDVFQISWGWVAGETFYADFSRASSHYYGDSKTGDITDAWNVIADFYEEDLGYGWVGGEGFVPDKTRTTYTDNIYYDDERGRLTKSPPQGYDNDEDLGEGWIGGWMSRFISEEVSIDYDRDLVPDALERELGLTVGNFSSPAEDSDGDGLFDAEEVQQGSDPSNANDTFATPNSFKATQGSRVPVVFTIGDHSGSHSEQWELKIYNQLPGGGEELTARIQAGLGVLASREFEFAEGFRQRIALNHVRGEGDYDYTFEIVVGSSDGSVGLVLDDPDSLVGVKNDVSTNDLSGDVMASVPKKRLKTPQGDQLYVNLTSPIRRPVYFEAAPLSGPGSFKLTQSTDKIKIWDSETDGTALTTPNSQTKSWSLNSSQLAALNASNRIWIEGLEISEEVDDTSINLQYYDENNNPIGEPAKNTVTLLQMDIENLREQNITDAFEVSNVVTNQNLDAQASSNGDLRTYRIKFPADLGSSAKIRFEIYEDGSLVDRNENENGELPISSKSEGGETFYATDNFRFVTWDTDDAHAGNQTIKVKLGDTVRMNLVVDGNDLTYLELPIGLPPSESSAKAIRTVDTRFVKLDYGNVASDASPSNLIERMDKVFAQGAVRFNNIDETTKAPVKNIISIEGNATSSGLLRLLIETIQEDGSTAGTQVDANTGAGTPDAVAQTIASAINAEIGRQVATSHFTYQNSFGSGSSIPEPIAHVVIDKGEEVLYNLFVIDNGISGTDVFIPSTDLSNGDANNLHAVALLGLNYGDGDSNTLEIFITNEVSAAGTGGRGTALPHYYTSSNSPIVGGYCIRLSASKDDEFDPFIAPHEAGHILLDVAHPSIPNNLMLDGSNIPTADSITATKRITDGQIEDLRSSTSLATGMLQSK